MSQDRGVEADNGPESDCRLHPRSAQAASIGEKPESCQRSVSPPQATREFRPLQKAHAAVEEDPRVCEETIPSIELLTILGCEPFGLCFLMGSEAYERAFEICEIPFERNAHEKRHVGEGFLFWSLTSSFTYGARSECRS